MKKMFARNIYRNAILLFLCLPGLQSLASVHFSESFTSPSFPLTTWTNGSYTLSSGSWDVQYAMGLSATNAYNSSGGAAELNRYLGSYLTTPSVNSVGTVSFYYRNFNTALGGGTFKVQKSVNGGAFVDISTTTFTSVTSYTYYSVAVNDASNNIKIRIYCPTANSSFLCIDEMVVTDMGQTLAANPSTLSGINYYVGNGPSSSQNFNLFGSNLTGYPGSISLTAPTNFEISSNNSTFSSILSIPYSTATLSSTPIYVRLKAGLALNDYNSEIITITGGGAATLNVTCNGSVTVAPSPTIIVNPTTLSGFNYAFGSGPSVAQSYSVIGTYLTGYPGNIVVTAPVDYEVSLDYSTYASSLNIPYSSATLSSVIVYVRLKAGLSASTYNSEIVANVGGGATTNVTCNGSVSPPPSPMLSVNPTTLTGLNYIVGSGPSTSQYYTLSGGNLSGYPGNVVVTASINYEVSINNSVFSSSVNVPYTSANLSATPIYVRLKSGLAIASYNSEIITNAVSGASTVNVTCSGSVAAVPSPLLVVNPSSLTGFSYIVGSGPSTSQSYNLSGSYLTGYPGNIIITAPTNYEVSNDNSIFAASLNVAYTSATLASTPIYVRLKAGLAIASYNSEIVTNAGGGSTSENVTCSGSVTAVPPATLAVSPSTLTGYTYIVGSGPSTSQSYNLSGSYLTGYPSNIVISAPASYEISLSLGSGYTTSLNVAYTSATLVSTPIYVRLKAGLAVALYNSEIIANAGGGATTANVTCSGSVTEISTTCGNETFTNIPTATASSYSDRTWTGDDGNTWTSTTARTDQTITGKAICFKGFTESPVSPNGIGDLTVTTKFPFADGVFDLPVLVNGVQVGVVPVSTTETTITLTGINIAGDVQIKFLSNGTKRPAIDDLSWTCYSIVTGVDNEQEASGEFSLVPNPNNGSFTILFNTSVSEKRIVQITNLIGQTVFEEDLTDLQTSIILPENIKNGWYLVRVIQENKLSVKKMLIN